MTDPAAPVPDDRSASAPRTGHVEPETALPDVPAPAPGPQPPAVRPAPAPDGSASAPAPSGSAPAPYGSAPAPYGLAPAPVPPAPAYAAWGQPVYAAAPPKGLSVASMVIGLVSVVFFWTFLCPIVGLVLGIVGIRREPAGRGFAVAGLILNGILLLIPVVVLVFLLAAGAAVFGAAATSGG